jgi:hypothetical protein
MVGVGGVHTTNIKEGLIGSYNIITYNKWVFYLVVLPYSRDLVHPISRHSIHYILYSAQELLTQGSIVDLACG